MLTNLAIAASVSSPTYDSLLASYSPVGWWKLSESVGSGTVADSSGNGATGTVGSNVTLGEPAAAPNLSTSALISGSSAISGTASTALSDAFTGGGDVTVLAWAKKSGSGPSGPTIFSIGSGGSRTNFALLATSGWDISFNGGDITFSASPSVSTWYMVSARYSGGNWTLNINGTDSQTLSGSAPAVTSSKFNLGTMSWDTGNFWDGYLSEIAVFSSALTSTQLSNLYSSATTSATSTLTSAALRASTASSRASSI